MKTVLSILFVFVFAGTLFAQSDKVKISDPISYNDYIVNEQNEIGDALLDLMDVISDVTSTEEMAMYQLGVLTAAIDLSIIDLENLETIKNDYGIRRAALDLFGFYKRIMGTQYVEMIGQLYSEVPDMEVIDRISQEVTEEEKEFDAAFQLAQQAFASAHGFTLTPNSLQEELDGAGQ